MSRDWNRTKGVEKSKRQGLVKRKKKKKKCLVPTSEKRKRVYGVRTVRDVHFFHKEFSIVHVHSEKNSVLGSHMLLSDRDFVLIIPALSM